MINITKTVIEGFDAVAITNDEIALTILPALGGKISSLRDLRSGREWLWRNPRLNYRTFPHGSGYNEADTGGWDECFPTVAACSYPSPPWQGATLQDHGELWSQQPAFRLHENEHGTALVTEWHGVALPYTFTRTIHLAPDSQRLRFDYRAKNRADQPMPVIWSAHPLLAIEPGMCLHVPKSARFNTWSTVPDDLLETQRGITWPLVAQGLDLATLPGSSGLALKLWSVPLAQGSGVRNQGSGVGDAEAKLVANDGALRMRWDVALLPQFAFWLNLGGWAGTPGEPYYNLGFEPCIGAQDSLAQAVEQELFLTLPAHGEHRWWLDVELDAG